MGNIMECHKSFTMGWHECRDPAGGVGALCHFLSSASVGTELPRAGGDRDLVGGYHPLHREQSATEAIRAAGDCFHDPNLCPSCAKTGCKNCGDWGEKGCAPCEPEPEPRLNRGTEGKAKSDGGEVFYLSKTSDD